MSDRRKLWFGVALGAIIGFCAGFLAVGIGTARDAARASADAERGRLYGEIAELRHQIEIMKNRRVDRLEVREGGTVK
jgi:hypothetical protein